MLFILAFIWLIYTERSLRRRQLFKLEIWRRYDQDVLFKLIGGQEADIPQQRNKRKPFLEKTLVKTMHRGRHGAFGRKQRNLYSLRVESIIPLALLLERG